MFNLATLFIDIAADTARFDRAMANIHGQLSRADIAVGAFRANVATMLARAAVSAGAGLFDATILSAADLHETINKTAVVFGGASASMIGFAEEMADKFALPKQAMLDASSIFGLMGKTAGQSKDQAADFGIAMTKLAVDIKSFYDVPIEEALHKIQSGLAGQSRPLREYGVFINAATVAQEALALGLAKTKGELSEGDKIMARASLITKGLTDSTGDMERTFGETRNQMSAFWGILGNLGTEIGAVLMPAFDDILRGVVGMAKGLSAGFRENREMFSGWVAAFVSGFDAVKSFANDVGAAFVFMFDRVRETFAPFPGFIYGWLVEPLDRVMGGALSRMPEQFAAAFSSGVEWLKAIRAAIHDFGDSWEIVQIQAGGSLTNIMAILGTFPENVAIIAEYIGKNWYQLITDGLDATTTAFMNFIDNMGNLGKAVSDFLSNPAGGFRFTWTPLLEGFKATAAALPELIKPDLISVQDQIDAVTGRTANKRAQDLADAAKPKSELALLAESAARSSKMGPQGGDDEPDKFKAQILGAADFASKLRLAQGSEDVPAKQLTVLQQIREQDQKNGEALAKMADQTFGAILA